MFSVVWCAAILAGAVAAAIDLQQLARVAVRQTGRYMLAHDAFVVRVLTKRSISAGMMLLTAES
jgi:hypothetical protein